MAEPEYATVGPIPAPSTCDECGDPTKDSALCNRCAWSRYDDQLAEWWGKHPLRDEAS